MAKAPTDQQSPLARAHNQLIETIRERMQANSARYDDRGGYIFYDLGCPENDTHLRGITLHETLAEKDLPALAQNIAQMRADPRSSWGVRAHPASLDLVHDFLIKEDFAAPETYPIMARAELVSWTYRYEVQEYQGETEVLKGAQLLLSTVFDLSEATSEEVISERLFGPESRNLLAYIEEEGEIVCIGLLTMRPDAETAGLYYISSHPEKRGQGLAKDLVAHLTNRAFATGASLIILQASTLGEFVYRHLGYEEIGRYGHFALEG